MKRSAFAVCTLGLLMAFGTSARAKDEPAPKPSAPAPGSSPTSTPTPNPPPSQSPPEQQSPPAPISPTPAPAPAAPPPATGDRKPTTSDAEPSDAEPSDAEPSDAEPSDAEPSDAEAAPAVSAPDDIPDEELEMPLIPPHEEGQSGHFRLALGGAFAAPFGSFHEDLGQSERITGGFAGYGAATIGVSPTVALGVGGDLSFFSGSDACPTCSATSLGFGPRVAYHLVQGTRFDPWAAIGVGYRTTTLDLGSTTDSYAGIEWLHLEVGGDWYPSPHVGLGPFMLLNSGVYATRPENTERAMYWSFLVGFRALFHAPGRAGSSSR